MITSAIIIVVLGLFVFVTTVRTLTGPERAIAMLSYIAHLIMGFGQVVITQYYYGGGDSLAYFRRGRGFAQLLDASWSRFAPDVLALMLGSSDVALPGAFVGTTTGSMQGVATWLAYFFGDSFLAADLFCAVCSAIGGAYLYRAMRPTFSADMRKPTISIMLLTPSLVFWTSGLLKESFAFTGLGFAVWGLRLLMDRRPVPSACFLVIGVGAMWLFKPFYVAALAAATGGWFVARRYGVRFRLRHAIGSLVGAALAMLIAGAIMPRFSPTNLADEFQNYQKIGAATSGGSNYVVFANASGIGEQVFFAPLAVITALFRPFIFEAHNALAAVSAVESTAFLVFFIVLIARSPVGTLSQFLATPDRMFASVFVVILALGVGLATTNLGTLTRYRVPILPFLGYVLLHVYSERKKRREIVRHPAAPLAGRRTR